MKLPLNPTNTLSHSFSPNVFNFTFESNQDDILSDTENFYPGSASNSPKKPPLVIIKSNASSVGHNNTSANIVNRTNQSQDNHQRNKGIDNSASQNNNLSAPKLSTSIKSAMPNFDLLDDKLQFVNNKIQYKTLDEFNIKRFNESHYIEWESVRFSFSYSSNNRYPL